MVRVFFKRCQGGDPAAVSQAARSVLERVIGEGGTKLGGRIPLKVHFGEEGNITYTRPWAYDGIIDLVVESGGEPVFMDTNALYAGQRMVRDDHIRLAREHGFTRIPVVIADGERGEDFGTVAINKKRFTECMVAREVLDSPVILILSHFKGHMLAGFGGSLKQLAMGCASRGGKLAQHSTSKPYIRSNDCTQCKECLDHCPADAIIIGSDSHIIEDRCIGCAACTAVCQHGAVQIPWNKLSVEQEFHEKVAESAYAAQLGRTALYLSYLIDITKSCDCMGRKMTPIVPDIGVVGSMDPVACDRASLDIIGSETGSNPFQEGHHALSYGEEIGLGSRSYELVEL